MVKIVESNESYITALRELFLKVRQNAFTWADAASFNILDFDKETEGENVLIAICEGGLVGFISVWLADNFIHHLYIDEKHQKKGIGTALLKAALAKTKFPVRLKCIENNIKAVNFYKKNGFIEKGRGTTEEGAFILFELNDEG
jgi:GNAT superfamily N-acetyltransferase